MSGCFSAALFPLFDSKERFLRSLIVLSIVVAGRSLPIAVFFVAVAAWLFIQKRYKWILVAAVASFAVGFTIKGKLLFHPRGRDFIWSATFHYFREHMSWTLGGGLGAFYLIGLGLSQGTSSGFIWLHSDWYQTFFEQGILGFLAVLLMYGHAVWRSRTTPQLFVALMAYAAFGVANMPLRYPIAGLYGAVLIRWAMDKTETGEEINDQRSEIKDQRSQIKDQGSKIKNRWTGIRSLISGL